MRFGDIFNLQGYGYGILVEGGLITLSVAVVSLLIACVLGLCAALAKLSKNPVPRTIGTLYTTLIRGVPDLVLMMLIFFGGQVFVNNLPQHNLDLLEFIGGKPLADSLEPYVTWDSLDINPFIAGTLTIGLIFGAYMGETFRGAIMAVEKGMLEAGEAYGMTKGQVLRRILLPQMMRHALPGFGNNWLVLMKTTALVSIIGLNDMVRKANLAAGATRDPFTFYFVVALAFLAFTTLSLWALRWAENRYSVGVRRA